MAEKQKEATGLLAMLGEVLSARNRTLEAEIIAAAEREDHEPPSDTPKEAEVIPFNPPAATKQIVTPERLQAILLAGLRQIEGFPEHGVSTAVYGCRPWNAMITFAPGSTSLKNATKYREAMHQLVEKLRERFDIEG